MRKLVAGGVLVGSTPTGISVVECFTCGWTHPVTRRHCPVCGLASLFGHETCREELGLPPGLLRPTC